MQTVLGNTIYGAATPCNTHITHFPPQKSSVDTNANVRRVLNDLIKSVLRVSSRNNEIERRCTIEYRSQSTVMKVVWHRMCGFEVFFQKNIIYRESLSASAAIVTVLSSKLKIASRGIQRALFKKCVTGTRACREARQGAREKKDRNLA